MCNLNWQNEQDQIAGQTNIFDFIEVKDANKSMS